jgi:hypothetical protein|tara:strand:- start:89 stop:313 length:225 start_codon:yes stop_codon:yes gene_type:complete
MVTAIADMKGRVQTNIKISYLMLNKFAISLNVSVRGTKGPAMIIRNKRVIASSKCSSNILLRPEPIGIPDFLDK